MGVGGVGEGVWKGTAAGLGNFWVAGRVIEFFVVMSCRVKSGDKGRSQVLSPKRLPQSSDNIA